MNSSAPSLPYNGESYKSRDKKFAETILFVPFYKGHKKSMQRHIQLVNELGFDAVAFDLYDDLSDLRHAILSAKPKFGLKHVWADQIENMLNFIPGQKIIFSFSNPSASAMEAIARRNGSDVKALVMDSGPTGDLFNSTIKYFKHEVPVPTLPLRMALAAVTTLLWHPNYKNVIHLDLAKFPKGFPLLSIRGWKDKLVSPQLIDSLLEPHSQIEWQKLSLPEAGHLNGLKDFASEYKSATEKFLKAVAAPFQKN
jgi:pimeloyl-ACP methyl ester carboxylesterase